MQRKRIVTPSMAAAVYSAKGKHDSTILLKRKTPYLFYTENPVHAHNLSRDINLLLTVKVRFLSFSRPPKSAQFEDGKTYKLMYFELSVSDAHEVSPVIQCHCQKGDHGDGKVHIHKALPGGKTPKRTTVPWPGITNYTPVGEAFRSAMKHMQVEAQYQELLLP